MSKKIVLAACITGLFQVPAVLAENSGFVLTPSVGYYDFDSDRAALADTAVDPDNYDDDSFYSLGLGYRFDSPWQVEAVYLDGDTNTDLGDIDFSQWRVDGLYHMKSDGDIIPYWLVGAGENKFDETTGTREETIVNYGVGFKYTINDLLAVRADLRGITSLDEEDTDVALTVGLQFLFGGGGSAPVREVAAAVTVGDSDNDGINDDVDNCPNTPAGVEVDSMGCAFDDDNDGVTNHRDNCPDSDAGAKVDSEGCYITLQESREIELQINFPNNSSIIPASFYNEIKAVADFMTQYPNTDVVIEGHTDSRGSEAYNQQLSDKRAGKVADALVDTYGVDSSRVSSEGHGESRPIANNDTAEGRDANRRVVAVIATTVERRAQ